MPDEPTPEIVPPEAKAAAQHGPARRRAPARKAPEPPAAEPQEGRDFIVSPRVELASQVRPYQRQSGDPLYRRLRIFTRDPSASQLEGQTAVISVPYEPLQPGPVGALFEVDSYDQTAGRHYVPLDLDAPAALLQDGRPAAIADPQFHQQMAYAVCCRVYNTFRSALGRDLAWGFDHPHRRRLLIRPDAFERRNAFYDPRAGELQFGYFAADAAVEGRNLPGGIIFTCLSHDVVAHEMTHALLDGLRARFLLPTGPDVMAFHEALADLVALFLRFEYTEVVAPAVRKAAGRLREAPALADLAQQFGQTTGAGRALRTALDEMAGKEPTRYDERLETHRLGSVLVAAIFDAFLTIFERRSARAMKLATGGTGVPPTGELHPELVDELTRIVAKVAKQFLAITIRAIDYLPTVDVRFGEYLRALITADYDLVPDDPFAYREALVDGFRKRGIYPRGVPSLSPDALRWAAPTEPLPPIDQLTFANLRFAGDPGRAFAIGDVKEQARGLGAYVVKHASAFGLAPADPTHGVEPPCVESIRTLRRIGPDGQVVFELVAEITQMLRNAVEVGRGKAGFYGGATVIIGPDGVLRYTVYKRVSDAARLDEQRVFISSGAGKKLWTAATDHKDGRPASLFAMVHEGLKPRPVERRSRAGAEVLTRRR